MSLSAGDRLGHYEVLSLLGEGGMGSVFVAQHRFLGDRVALKVLHGTYANNPQIAQRFFQEAKSARDIGHPSIVKVLDFGQSDDGSLYLVMELLGGQSLKQVIAGGALDEAFTARVIADVAEGLAAAHAKGIVHRDLKPDNLFLLDDGVKILDFGIAKVQSSSVQTSTNAIMGTPAYMSPEQARGAQHVGPHTDVYALGVILFQMVTGRLPFNEPETVPLLLKITMEPPPRPSELARISPEMESIILSCLAKDPAARPPSMDALKALLVQRAGVQAVKPTRTERDATPPAPVRQTGTPTPAGTITSANAELSRPARAEQGASRHRGVVGGVAALGVLAALGIGLAVSHRSNAPVGAPDPAPRPLQVPVTPPAPPPPEIPAHLPPPRPIEQLPPPMAARPAARPIIESEPSGAHVFIDGKDMGKTPLTVEGVEGSFAFTLRQHDYDDASGEVTEPGQKVSITLTKKVRPGTAAKVPAPRMPKPQQKKPEGLD